MLFGVVKRPTCSTASSKGVYLLCEGSFWERINLCRKVMRQKKCRITISHNWCSHFRLAVDSSGLFKSEKVEGDKLEAKRPHSGHPTAASQGEISRTIMCNV